MKETYEKIDWSKVANKEIKAQMDEVKSGTDNFSDPDLTELQDYKDVFSDLVGMIKKDYPEAMGGKAEEKAEPKAESKEKKAEKPAKAKKEKKGKAKKAEVKKDKPKKDAVLFKGKPISQADCDELIKEYKERREASKKSAKKSKTKSIFEKVTDKIESVVEQAIKSVGAKEVSENPKAFSNKVDAIAEATKEYLQKFKAILGDEYDAQEVQDVVKQIEAVADKIRKKYEKK